MTYPRRMITKTAFTPGGPSPTGSAPGIWRLDEVAYWQKQGLWPDASADAYWSYTSLLLSSTSLSNANNNLFVDSSGAFNPVSRNGNTTQGSFTPYGSYWSNYFDGNADWLRTTAINISSGDFTVEAWVYLNAMPTSDSWPGSYTNWMEVLGVGTASIGDGWQFRIGQTVLAFGTNGDTTAVSATHNMVVGQWYHLAVTRSGNVYTLYKNGTSIGSATYTANNPGTGAYTWVGCETGEGAYLNGYISNARIVAGTAVYTSTFTPPAAPLTAISGTSLLTCQSNRFIDTSSNAFAITVNGDTKVQKFSPFTLAAPGVSYNQSDITNWSGYLDGSSYWTVPTSTALDVWDNGSGSFTVEAWIFATAGIGNNVSIVSKAPNNGSPSWSPGWAFQVFNGYLNVNTPGDTRLFNSNTTSVPLNQWVHCALVKSGSTVSIYQNGVRVGTTTNSNAYSNTTDAVAIGVDRNFAGSKLVGYVSNARMVKGVAVYDPSQSTITVPTTPLTAVSGTSLLTLQNAAFTDNSTNNFVITQNGNPTVTGNSPFNTVGYWSNYFDGSGDYFTVPYTTANFDWWTSGTDFTIEYWFFANSSTGISYSDAGFNHSTVVGNRSATTTTDYWSFGPTSAGTVTFYYFNGGANAVTSTATYSLNTWNHVAMTKTSSGITVFVNGVAGTTTAISGTPQSSTGVPLTVGQGNNSSFNGYVSNLRIVRGTAIYSGSFTVPTTPLTAVTNTKLLTCQNGRFIDNSTNALTITPADNVAAQSFDPFYTATIASNGGSMYFDGSGDYLTVPYAGNMRYAGDFTIECWVYPTARLRLYPCIVSNYSTFTSNGGFAIFAGHNSANTSKYNVAFNGSFPFIQSTSDIVYGAWAHIALVRVGSTITLYINGVANGTGTSSAAVVGTANNWWVGTAGDSLSDGAFNGYINGLRTTPSAVYTAAFTPPTAPQNPTSATTLLLNGMNAGIYDATTINDMETVGNAQVTTAVYKYGTGSMAFDGSGDYLVSRGNTILLGSGNFTVEFWVYFNAVNNGTVKYLYDFRTASATSASFLAQEASNAWTYWNGAGSSVTTGLSGSTFATGQWYHVAITRSSNVLYCFVNGTKVSSDPADSSNYASATMTLGARYSGSDGLNGYIDDVRLTAGVARYTANFTPPTQPFPTY